MPDNQDKSDDLIAELAKLMASNAGAAAEPESKPAPKLVTLPEAQRAETPAPMPIRIPGMDAPVAAAPQQSAPTPAAPTPAPAAAPLSGLRIPGMDQPVPVSSAPPPSSPPSASPPSSPPPSMAPVQPPRPVDVRPAASFDFGTVPATSSLKPEPMSNWQDREIPKPVPSRPVAAPVVSVEPPKPASTVADPVVETQAASQEPAPKAAADEPPSPMVAAAKASPAGDSFDFDFGFASNPPGPIATPEPTKPAVPPAAARSSADPIADLIAAELDSADAEAASESPRPVQPAPRSFSPAPMNTISTPRAGQPMPAPFRPQGSPQSPVSKPEDRFGVAPVFGPAGRSQVAAQPKAAAERDPMEEIESLIGEAVRVELTPDESRSKEAPTPAPAVAAASTHSAPVVPPLTASLPPRRSVIKDRDSEGQSPEAAILAAAAASGAEVGRLDSVVDAPSPYKRVKAKPERRSGGMRQYVGMAVAGTLLLAAGFGLYWVLGMGRGGDAEAPVLQADATPAKEIPAPAPTEPTAQQGAVVFNELNGGNAQAPVDEQLVSRDDTAETSVADVARTVGDTEDGASESELANRKVRTVTVRPDGTIVSGDEAVAGNEELPVDRPNVPDLPGADVQPSELLAAIPADTATPTTNAAGAALSTQPLAATDTTTLASVTPTDAGPAATIDPNIIAPVPVARPADRSVLGGGANQRVATTQPVETQPTSPAPAATSGSGPYVQLSSQPTQPDAESSLRATQNRLSGLLSGRSLAIRQVNLGAKGTWYRVVLPVDSFQEATQTCASFKANGIDCVPIGG